MAEKNTSTFVDGPLALAVIASAVTFEIADHGGWRVLPSEHAKQMKRLRKDLLQEVVWIYEGASGRGDKASHWRGYSKSDLAAIVADGTGSFAERVQAARRADQAATQPAAARAGLRMSRPPVFWCYVPFTIFGGQARRMQRKGFDTGEPVWVPGHGTWLTPCSRQTAA